MPLFQGKSKKAFDKNVESEMDAGKPQKQSLAIAYNIKNKNKRKKMASGGRVEESADSESRPMPDKTYNDKDSADRNRGNKPPKHDEWTDNSTIEQAQRPSITKLSQPKLVGSDAFSVRNRDMRDDENDMGDRLPPESDRAQPVKRDDEEGPNRQGPKVPDMERQHNNKRSAYEMAVEHEYAQDMAAAEMKKVQSLARGGPVMEPADHEMELMERSDEGDMQSRLSPGEHGEQPKSDLDEVDADGSGDDVPDMEREHSNGRKPYSMGGEISIEPEEQEEKHASVAAAIMSKRKKMASGGMVDLEENSKEQPNNEDDMSYDAVLKEQYDDSQISKQPEDSNEHGDEIDSDKHDMVEMIRRKMQSKRASRQP